MDQKEESKLIRKIESKEIEIKKLLREDLTVHNIIIPKAKFNLTTIKQQAEIMHARIIKETKDDEDAVKKIKELAEDQKLKTSLTEVVKKLEAATKQTGVV